MKIYLPTIISSILSLALLITPHINSRLRILGFDTKVLPIFALVLMTLLALAIFILGGYSAKAVCLFPLVIAVSYTLLILTYILQRVSTTLASVILSTIIMLIIVPAGVQMYLGLENLHEILLAILQTNWAEAKSFGKSILWDHPLLIFGITTLLFVVTYLNRKATRKSFRKVHFNPLYGILLMLTAYLPLLYAEDMSTMIFPKIHDSAGLLGTSEKYIQQVHQGIQQGNKLPESLQHGKLGDDFTMLVVIGESLSRNFMSLYDYPITTNPQLGTRLETDNFIQFQSCYAAAYVTRVVVPMMLSTLNEYDTSNYALSIFSLLDKVGIKSYWLSSQHKAGVYDAAVSMMTEQANVAKYAPAGEIQMDGALLPNFATTLAKKGPKVIFLHLWGQHKNAEDTYPHEAPFLRDTTYEFSNQYHYDNSVVYNDHVVDKMLHELDKHTKNNAFIYLSDHGDTPGKLRIKEYLDYSMLRIPMLMRFSETYTANNKRIVDELKKKKEAYWSNDLFFDLMLGILSITDHPHYKSQHDLSSPEYNLTIETVKTANGIQVKDDPYL